MVMIEQVSPLACGERAGSVTVSAECNKQPHLFTGTHRGMIFKWRFRGG